MEETEQEGHLRIYNEKQKTKLKLPSMWELKILTIIINLGGEGRDQELKVIIGYYWAYVISRPGCT